MAQFVFRHFESFPTGPARILHVARQLQQTEVGRLFMMSLPPFVTFIYFEGDSTSRASAESFTGRIRVSHNTLRSSFETAETVIHELAHLVQHVQHLDLGLKTFLEGAFAVLNRHRSDRRLAWVAEPLDRVRTEETMAQDLVGLIFRLGWGRKYRNRYYVPGDEASPPPGALRPTLTAPERGMFLAAMRRLQAARLSPEQLRANWEAYEEFYARALKVGWVGEDQQFRAKLGDQRLQRGMVGPRR